MNRKRILIVDDEVGSTRLLKANLERTNGYEVRVENWAEDAVPAAREFKPHLVLLDVLMPRMPGGNVAAAFKADPELKHTPIVFLTGAVRRQTVAEHEGNISGYPFLAKPASMEEIIKMIETHSSLPGAPDTSPARPASLPSPAFRNPAPIA